MAGNAFSAFAVGPMILAGIIVAAGQGSSNKKRVPEAIEI